MFYGVFHNWILLFRLVQVIRAAKDQAPEIVAQKERWAQPGLPPAECMLFQLCQELLVAPEPDGRIQA